MPAPTVARLTATVHQRAHPLIGRGQHYGPLLARIGDAPFVLLGEASHGTHEFYRARAQITTRLVVEKGFTAVAVEADWPDAHRVNRYVRGANDDASGSAALAGRWGKHRKRFLQVRKETKLRLVPM